MDENANLDNYRIDNMEDIDNDSNLSAWITFINTKGGDLKDIKDALDKLKYEKKTIENTHIISIAFPMVDNYIIEGKEYRFKCWNYSSNKEYYLGEL